MCAWGLHRPDQTCPGAERRVGRSEESALRSILEDKGLLHEEGASTEGWKVAASKGATLKRFKKASSPVLCRNSFSVLTDKIDFQAESKTVDAPQSKGKSRFSLVRDPSVGSYVAK